MNPYTFQADSWRHLLYSAPRFARTHWLLMGLFIAGYFCSQYLSPRVETWTDWYALGHWQQTAWYLSLLMTVAFPLTLTFAVLRFICLDDGVKLTLSPGIVMRFLVAYSVIYIAIGLGVYLLVLPGFLLWTCTLLVPVLILAHGYSAAEAFYASYDAVKGHIWKITLGFLPIVAAIVLLHLGLLFLFEQWGWEAAAHILNALMFQLSVIVSASYTMTLYGHAEYHAASEPHGLKIR